MVSRKKSVWLLGIALVGGVLGWLALTNSNQDPPYPFLKGARRADVLSAEGTDSMAIFWVEGRIGDVKKQADIEIGPRRWPNSLEWHFKDRKIMLLDGDCTLDLFSEQRTFYGCVFADKPVVTVCIQTKAPESIWKRLRRYFR